jgi:hypothetical protein
MGNGLEYPPKLTESQIPDLPPQFALVPLQALPLFLKVLI